MMGHAQLAISRATSRPGRAEPPVIIATAKRAKPGSALRSMPSRPDSSGRETEDRRGGQPVDQVRAEILGEDPCVVLPDRLVQARGWQDDVAGGPHPSSERCAEPNLGVRYRPPQHGVRHSIEDAV